MVYYSKIALLDTLLVKGAVFGYCLHMTSRLYEIDVPDNTACPLY